MMRQGRSSSTAVCCVWAWLLCCCCCTQLVTADFEHVCFLGQGNMGLCGENLAGMMSTVCGMPGMGGYHSGGKRSAIPEMRSHRIESDDLFQEIFIPKEVAHNYLKKRGKRGKWLGSSSPNGFQGIVCECCHNQCTYGELVQYCAAKGGKHGKRSALPLLKLAPKVLRGAGRRRNDYNDVLKPVREDEMSHDENGSGETLEDELWTQPNGNNGEFVIPERILLDQEQFFKNLLKNKNN